MPYFNLPADETHLSSDVRDHPDAEAIAGRVEAEIIGRYTGEEEGAPVVQLAGYDEDPAEADDDLRAALTDTIGFVTSHRLRHERATVGVESESVGRRSKSYGAGFNVRWPHEWYARLIRFDERPATWRP